MLDFSPRKFSSVISSLFIVFLYRINWHKVAKHLTIFSRLNQQKIAGQTPKVDWALSSCIEISVLFFCSCSYLWRSCCPIDKKWPFSVKRLIRNGSCFSPKNLPFAEQSYHRFASFIIPKTSLDRVSIWLILSLVASLHSEWMKSCARFLIFFHNPSSVDPHCWLFSIQLAFFVWGGLCGIPREIPFEMCLGCLGISFAPHKSAIPMANPSDGIQFWVECTISENIINVDVMNGFVPIYQIAKRNRMYGVLTRALSMQSVHIHGCRLNLHKFSRSLHQLILFFFNIHHVNVHGLRREILICLSRSNNSQVFGWN